MKERTAEDASAAEQAVLRAIAVMRERMGEQLTIDDLAHAAMFSKFHFTRVFQRVTGISPGRFLSALRLQQAKDLLVSTSMSVADISTHVGYNSVGTFSSRFSRSVGMSPSTFRRRSGFAPMVPAALPPRAGRSCDATLTCRVRLAEPDDDAVVFVGIFPDRIPEGRPVRCAVLGDREQARWESVPTGRWYLLAQSTLPDGQVVQPERIRSYERILPHQRTVRGDRGDARMAVAAYGPFFVRPGWSGNLELILRPSRLLDPPVLLALLDTRQYALPGRASRAHEELIPTVA